MPTNPYLRQAGNRLIQCPLLFKNPGNSEELQIRNLQQPSSSSPQQRSKDGEDSGKEHQQAIGDFNFQAKQSVELGSILTSMLTTVSGMIFLGRSVNDCAGLSLILASAGL